MLNRGLWKTDDAGLMFRCLNAVAVWEAAQQFSADQNQLTDYQWEIVVKCNNEISPIAKRAPRIIKRA